MTTGEKEPGSGQPQPMPIKQMGYVSAAMLIPHMMYPDAFQAAPESFVIGVDEDGKSPFYRMSDTEPTEAPTVDNPE